MTLTKAQMAEFLRQQYELKKEIAQELVEEFFEEIRLTLEKGKEIKLSGFGKFELREKNSRPGRNPRTREEYTISARRVVTFRPGHKLKKRIENVVIS